MIFDNLREIINPHPDILIDIQVYRGGDCVVLEENDPSATLRRVELVDFERDNTFAFKLDAEGKPISNYLHPSTSKINKACDTIIFTKIEELYYIFLCELKSKKPNIQDCIIKYRNSELFVRYLVGILERFYDVKIKFQYRFILFDTKKRTTKTPTKSRKIQPTVFTDSDRGTKINVYNIHHLDSFLNIRHLSL
ncbi:MAG: hypothetical protein J7647_31545 [Cyanobacteria bacterium SBLK]|nr:hypothetical protein [Cyanobacteria bacterium SBLK]